jgi:hypothetical protein
MVDRQTLKRRYQLALVVTLGLGFALGWTLRNPEVTGTALVGREVRDIERDFPGCAKTFDQLANLYAQGDVVRADYAALLERIEEACAKVPNYVPFTVLRAAVWEDWMTNITRKRYAPAAVAAIAKRVGLSEQAPAGEVAEACRAKAVEAWLKVEKSPLISEQEKYGARWRVLFEQHTNALRQTQVVRAPIDSEGILDLTRLYNVYALTRDFERCPNDLSAESDGYSFEEKHIQDVILCPQHADVRFHLPCLPYLAPNRGGTLRRDIALFRTGMRVTGQKLDIEPTQGNALHVLAFNTSADKHIVKAQVRILYTDGAEEVKVFNVPPWRQDETMLRDVTARRALDPVHRDSEVHLANGSELNFPWSPFYMYHVTIELNPGKRMDEIYFPRHDATNKGLEDAGIDDVCIVAMTMK